MIIGIAIFVAFIAIVAILIISYERPTKRRNKITGRGGDFAE
jgi:hypothetical protein